MGPAVNTMKSCVLKGSNAISNDGNVSDTLDDTDVC